MSNPEDPDALYRELNPQLVYAYCLVSAGAVLVFDQIITISDEVDHIWKRRFTGASLLFFLNRYATLLKTIVGLAITWTTSVGACVSWFSSSFTAAHVVNSCRFGEVWYNIFDILALFVFAAFSAFRVWAIWGREIRPFLIVLPFALVTPCLNLYRVSSESVVPEINPLPPPFGGCQFDYGIPLSVYVRFGDIVRGIAIATDALVLMMTWLRTRGIYRAAIRINAKPSLSTMLLRDGTVYFGVLLVFNVVDLIINHTNAVFNPVNLFNDVVNSILISRFMLNLRSVHSASNTNGDATFTQGHVDFIQSNILGDLGAAIDYGSSDASSSEDLVHSLPTDAESDVLSTVESQSSIQPDREGGSWNREVVCQCLSGDEESSFKDSCVCGCIECSHESGLNCASESRIVYGEQDCSIEVVTR